MQRGATNVSPGLLLAAVLIFSLLSPASAQAPPPSKVRVGAVELPQT